MKTFRSEFTPAFISQWIPGVLIERKALSIKNAAELEEADQNSVCFYQNKSFYNKLLTSKAGLIFVPADFDENLLPETNLLKVENPYIYYMMLLQKWLELEKPALNTDRHSSVVVHETAEVAEDVEIGANTVIAEGVKIGSGSYIGANCYIGKNVELGKNCYLYANVNIYEDCRLGANVILHSGVIIGADGFGFLLHQGKQFKLPQVGNVVIHNDVEIGANSCVDRATLGSTVIGEGTKLDNLVQIGHNCVIGKSTIICAQVGLAGNTRVGDRVYLAGQVGSADHVNIGDEVMVGAQSGVAGDVAAGKKVFGYPARDAGLTKRIMAAEKHLPEVVKHYRRKLKETK
ncbi:MAG: UDP-3-O-(3-hydroxymyristoyl)glucosamine N-acyltransferase [Candidatus Cloacimonetes bacterium]|nr:UDP-3-O-(3-hydroxymyristoyl)glucosamine N-acyltransferase [Candidatus Cloacimonadota bacterium]